MAISDMGFRISDLRMTQSISRQNPKSEIPYPKINEYIASVD